MLPDSDAMWPDASGFYYHDLFYLMDYLKGQTLSLNDPFLPYVIFITAKRKVTHSFSLAWSMVVVLRTPSEVGNHEGIKS